MIDRTLTLADGRTVKFAEYGHAPDAPVVWCHGGPGTRLEPAALEDEAIQEGLRIIAIDRPGYGGSTPNPGRDIASWVPDAIEVAERAGANRFLTLGVSTGGAYALALAAIAPERVSGVVMCCALTDMQWAEGREMMTEPAISGIWDAPTRGSALAIAESQFGPNGSKILELGSSALRQRATELGSADLAAFLDPERLAAMTAATQETFAFGLEGYVDDRIADGQGWRSFDVGSIRCPVRVIHGRQDSMVPVAHALHTVEIVPGATAHIYDELGHFTVVQQAIPTLGKMLAELRTTR